MKQCRTEQLSIDLAQPRDVPAVRALIVAGLTERWGTYDHSRNPDLVCFESHYADASTLVAKVDDVIVACGSLIAQAPRIGRIVRMSVAVTHRRDGIGRRLVRALLERAALLGYVEVVVETNVDWHSAIALYEGEGFVRTEQRDGDQHFRYVLP